MKHDPSEDVRFDALPGSGRREDYWSIIVRQFRKNRIAMVGLALVVLLFVVAIGADFIANDKPLMMSYEGEVYFPVLKDYGVRLGLTRWKPEFQNIKYKEFTADRFGDDDWAIFPPITYSPNDINLLRTIQPPSATNWLGTDDIGRDISSRMVHGSRVSLSVGFVAVSIYVAIGLLIGALAGYYGGVVDMVASRLIEIMLTIPTFFLIITVVAFLPQSIFNIMVVIGITNWPTVARLTRGEFLKAKSLDYVVAARALGASDSRTITNWPTVARLTRGEFLKAKSLDYVVAARALGASDSRTILRHILPNTLAPVFVAATFGVASAILIESTLSFLGFGVPPSTASWGSILASARTLLPSGWWLTMFPGLAIFLTVTSYNLVGEGLRDAADPRLKG